MNTAEVKVSLLPSDPALVELRRAISAADYASVGPRRRAFVAGWRLNSALRNFVVTLKPTTVRKPKAGE